jgi:hypothetical protein
MSRFGASSADSARQRQAVALRAKGLTYKAIGQRLGGISPQDVNGLLRRANAPVPVIACSRCHGTAAQGRFQQRTLGPVLCRACPDATPDVSYGVRLRSLRLAAGLTRRQLVKAAGLPSEGNIKAIEDGTAKPHQATRVKLAKALRNKDLERWEE